MNDRKIKVLSITGFGRSGSTVLDNLLGQLEGFVSVGELRYIWDRSLIENRLCGCGARFSECERWSEIMRRAFGSGGHLDPAAVAALRDRLRTRHLPLMLWPGGERRLRALLGDYPDYLERLYGAIHQSCNSRVIVDSSKFPSHSYTLAQIPMLQPYFVHLVRDPRGVAYSWQRRKPILDQGRSAFMDSHRPTKSSLIWNSWNLIAELLRRRYPERSLVLRYEDFISRPRQALERIADLVQETPSDLSFVEDQQVRLLSNHTVSGNPSRFQTGAVTLRVDEEWREKMPRRQRAMVTALTWPLLLRYDYLGRPSSTGSPR